MYFKNFGGCVLCLAITVSQRIEPPSQPPTFTLSNGNVIARELTVMERDVVTVVCSVGGGVPLVSLTTISCDSPVVDWLTSLPGSSNHGQTAVMNILIDKYMDGCSCTCSAKHISGKYSRTSKIVLNVQRGPEGMTTLFKASTEEQSKEIATKEHRFSLETTSPLYALEMRLDDDIRPLSQPTTLKYTSNDVRQILSPKRGHQVIVSGSKNDSRYTVTWTRGATPSTRSDQTTDGARHAPSSSEPRRTESEPRIIDEKSSTDWTQQSPSPDRRQPSTSPNRWQPPTSPDRWQPTPSIELNPTKTSEEQCLCASVAGLYFLTVYFSTILSMLCGFACYVKKGKRKTQAERRQSDGVCKEQESAASYMNISQESLLGLELEYCNMTKYKFLEPLDPDPDKPETAFNETVEVHERKHSLDADSTEYITPIDFWSDDLWPYKTYSEAHYSII